MSEAWWLLPAFILTLGVLWVVRSERKRNKK
jgi:cytochrome c-type biogenesis protein CcmH/NrfF